jgi:hypothetical protein
MERKRKVNLFSYYSNYKEFMKASDNIFQPLANFYLDEFQEHVEDIGVKGYKVTEDYMYATTGMLSDAPRLLYARGFPGRAINMEFRGKSYIFNTDEMLRSYEKRLQYYDFVIMSVMSVWINRSTAMYVPLIKDALAHKPV